MAYLVVQVTQPVVVDVTATVLVPGLIERPLTTMQREERRHVVISEALLRLLSVHVGPVSLLSHVLPVSIEH